MRQKILGMIALSLIWILSQPALAHCEIPCGIYGDRMRIDMLSEHIDTMEKSMKTIASLNDGNTSNLHQLVRWIDNKERHAVEFQEIVWQYFMTQRIKPVDENGEGRDKYLKQVEILHRMLIETMKCKQTTDLKHIENLRSLLKNLETAYFGHSH